MRSKKGRDAGAGIQHSIVRMLTPHAAIRSVRSAAGKDRAQRFRLYRATLYLYARTKGSPLRNGRWECRLGTATHAPSAWAPGAVGVRRLREHTVRSERFQLGL